MRVPHGARGASPIEQADAAVADAIAPVRDTPAVRTLGALSELADQPPLIALGGAVITFGLLRRRPDIARTGGRMLLAQLLATAMKSVAKALIDRSRPHVLLDEGRYDSGRGSSSDGPESSFPSGHTAGAVAVARAVARDYPDAAFSAYSAAAATAFIQVPRAAHYPTDVAAGFLIGLAAEQAAAAIIPPRPVAPPEPTARDIRID